MWTSVSPWLAVAFADPSATATATATEENGSAGYTFDFGGITNLVLADNSIDEDGAKMLGAALTAGNGARGITTLDLSACRLTDRAVAHFAPALAVAGKSGKSDLYGRPPGSQARITTLSLADNTALGDAGVVALSLVVGRLRRTPTRMMSDRR
jgi:hypothetical protein